MKFSIPECLKKNPIKSFFLFIIVVLVTWQVSLTASNTRDWRSGNENLPKFSLLGEILTVENFRDFYFLENGEEIKNWNTEKFDLSDIEGMDFIISHFADYHGIAHSFVTFRFANSPNITISMEARMEEGVKYSPFSGMLNKYEMMYIVGSERDTIGSRIGHRDEEVYLYKTTANKEISKKILLSFIEDINILNTKPRFYNTLWHNCTTVIVGQIEDVLDKNIWWSWEHLLPGYADEKALQMGFLENPQNIPFAEFEQNAKISGKNILQWDEEFEEKIRALQN